MSDAIAPAGKLAEVFRTIKSAKPGQIYLLAHPFPGPGLGVRILGEVRKEFADTLRLADHIFIEELRQHDLYDKVSQAFVVFLPVKSVGVTGDGKNRDRFIC